MSDNLKVEIDELYQLISSLTKKEDIAKLFNDLCTYKEIDAMAQRLKAAKLLINNETYDSIIAKTDISSATLSRVSRCVKYGEGYKSFIKKDN